MNFKPNGRVKERAKGHRLFSLVTVPSRLVYKMCVARKRLGGRMITHCFSLTKSFSKICRIRLSRSVSICTDRRASCRRKTTGKSICTRISCSTFIKVPSASRFAPDLQHSSRRTDRTEYPKIKADIESAAYTAYSLIWL